MTGSAINPRPTRTSGVFSIVAGILAVRTIATTSIQYRALHLVIAGIVIITLGFRGRERLWGMPLGVIGLTVSLLGIHVALTGPVTTIERIELVPGLIGLLVVTIALLPVRRGWERHLLTTGAGFLFVAVVTSAVVHGIVLRPLLFAGALTIVSWDLGEQAINLGQQVGTEASTLSAELAHAAASAGIALFAVLAAYVVRYPGVTDVPLSGLVVLLGAVLVFTVSLHQ